jgi:cytochrome c5
MKNTRGFIILLIPLASLSLDATAEKTAGEVNGNRPDAHHGEQIYKSACSACHDTGNNGAPQLSDAKAWEQRAFEWFSVMKKHATNGYLKMPPKGQHPQLTDQDVSDAVYYMQENINTQH